VGCPTALVTACGRVTIRVSPHGDTLLSREQTNLQRLMSSAEESCRNLAFSLALRSIQNNPR
jgi:hypothetical protein